MILKVHLMREAYMNTNLRSTQEVPEPLIERDWPHHEWRRRGVLVRGYYTRLDFGVPRGLGFGEDRKSVV